MVKVFSQISSLSHCPQRPDTQPKVPLVAPPPPPPPEPAAPPEPEEEILGSDDEEQEDPADYCKGQGDGYLHTAGVIGDCLLIQ